MLPELLTDEAMRRSLDQSILLAALVMARVVPLVQLVPYLGGKATPQMVKLGLALALAVLVYPAVWLSGAAAALPASPLVLAALVFKEVCIGLVLGFVAALVFEAVRMAGQMIDAARGQTMANVMVPQLPERVSVSANFGYQAAIVVFLMLGGHRIFLGGLIRSFVWIPPQSFPALQEGSLQLVALTVLRLTADAITLGLLLAFPVIASILLLDLFLALVNRAAPQINVFFLGMPLKALLGVAVLLLALDMVVARMMDEAFGQLGVVLELVEALGASPPPAAGGSGP